MTIRDLVLLVCTILLTCMLLWRYLPFPVAISVVTGTSMTPTIYPGSLVIGIRREPSIGDIVIVKLENEYIVHRIIGIRGDIIQTKGDGNYFPDPPVHKSQVRYVVVYVIPPSITQYIVPVIILFIIGVFVYFAYKYLKRFK